MYMPASLPMVVSTLAVAARAAGLRRGEPVLPAAPLGRRDGGLTRDSRPGRSGPGRAAREGGLGACLDVAQLGTRLMRLVTATYLEVLGRGPTRRESARGPSSSRPV